MEEKKEQETEVFLLLTPAEGGLAYKEGERKRFGGSEFRVIVRKVNGPLRLISV